MRLLFVLMVCLNLGYFLWVQVQNAMIRSAPAPAASIGAKSDAPITDLSLLAWAPQAQQDGLLLDRDSDHGGNDVSDSHGGGGGLTKAMLLRSEVANLVATRCWFIGPMPERVTAKQVQLRFGEEGITTDLLAIPRRGELGYGLYLSAASGGSAAHAQVTALQLAGFAGASVVEREAGLQVEVGHYETMQEAENTLALLQEQGYVAGVREQYGKVSEMMLRVALQQGQSVPDGLWLSLDADFTAIERQKNWCGPIASIG